MSDAELLAVWRGRLADGEPGLYLADALHPLQIFLGCAEDGSARVVIRSAAKSSKPGLSDLVAVDRYQDKSGKWNLSLTLLDGKFTEVFMRLVDDLHGRSAQGHDEAAALQLVNEVLDEWRRLLRPRPRGVLTLDELRGLVGELSLLLGRFSEHRSMAAAVEGWLGPLGLPQDFWYEESGHHEVKAIGPSVGQVRISSEHQLDADVLELLVMRVPTVSEDADGSVNLPALVARVESALSKEGSTAESFRERLGRLGVRVADDFYRETWFLLGNVDAYGVVESFPAIRSSALAEGIHRVRYQLALTSIANFKKSGEVGGVAGWRLSLTSFAMICLTGRGQGPRSTGCLRPMPSWRKPLTYLLVSKRWTPWICCRSLALDDGASPSRCMAAFVMSKTSPWRWRFFTTSAARTCLRSPIQTP